MKGGSVVVALIGVIGTLASILSLQPGTIKVLIITLFSGIVLIGAIMHTANNIDINGAWTLLKICKQFGIRRITKDRDISRFSFYIPKARQIRIITTSGLVLFKLSKTHLITALSNSAQIKVLLARPGSQFLMEIEESRSSVPKGHIDNDISYVETLLADCLKEAHKQNGKDKLVGKVYIGYFSTLFRNTLLICDNSWGLLTLILHPHGTPYTPSFEIHRVTDGLLDESINHFETVWGWCKENNLVKELTPLDGEVDIT